MRRLAVLPVLAAVALATPALLGTSSAAAPAGHGAASAPGHAAPGRAAGPAKPAKPAKHAKPAKAVVVVGAVTAVSGTPTVLTVAVHGGKDHRATPSVRVRLAATTAVTGNAGHGAAYVPAVGDKVTVHAVRGTDGVLVATRVAVSRRPVPTAGSATATVTTR